MCVSNHQKNVKYLCQDQNPGLLALVHGLSPKSICINSLCIHRELGKKIGIHQSASYWNLRCSAFFPFELWCWRRLLRVPWTARRSNQSILKEISPGCSLEGLMLKVKLQYFGHLMQRADLLEKTLTLGKTEGQGEGGSQG